MQYAALPSDEQTVYCPTAKTKGKSGGTRVITHTVLVESDGVNITLVTIYDKSDQDSITDRELKKLMKKNGLE